jgi:hypothetical protein
VFTTLQEGGCVSHSAAGRPKVRRSVRQAVRHTVNRVDLARHDRPWTLAFGLILPIPGTLAIIYGDGVSQALSNIAADTVSRTVGAALLTGALVTLAGLFRGRSAFEMVGLTLLAIGGGLYGLGVLFGLGLKGSVAASGFLAIALGAVLRLTSLRSQVRGVRDDEP